MSSITILLGEILDKSATHIKLIVETATTKDRTLEMVEAAIGDTRYEVILELAFVNNKRMAATFEAVTNMVQKMYHDYIDMVLNVKPKPFYWKAARTFDKIMFRAYEDAPSPDLVVGPDDHNVTTPITAIIDLTTPVPSMATTIRGSNTAATATPITAVPRTAVPNTHNLTIDPAVRTPISRDLHTPEPALPDLANSPTSPPSVYQTHGTPGNNQENVSPTRTSLFGTAALTHGYTANELRDWQEVSVEEASRRSRPDLFKDAGTSAARAILMQKQFDADNNIDDPDAPINMLYCGPDSLLPEAVEYLPTKYAWETSDEADLRYKRERGGRTTLEDPEAQIAREEEEENNACLYVEGNVRDPYGAPTTKPTVLPELQQQHWKPNGYLETIAVQQLTTDFRAGKYGDGKMTADKMVEAYVNEYVGEPMTKRNPEYRRLKVLFGIEVEEEEKLAKKAAAIQAANAEELMGMFMENLDGENRKWLESVMSEEASL